MTRRFAYDQSREPPAPVLPILFAAPGGEESVLVSSLVDTGADCTLVPVEIARRLRLPLVDRLIVEGLGGAARRAPVHAALVRFGGTRCLARVIAFDSEAIIGRDLLNRVPLLLDGPRLALSIR
ncbi:MAG: retroviral-like aspartic protease family protein [Candidatus Binatia bacterium]